MIERITCYPTYKAVTTYLWRSGTFSTFPALAKVCFTSVLKLGQKTLSNFLRSLLGAQNSRFLIVVKWSFDLSDQRRARNRIQINWTAIRGLYVPTKNAIFEVQTIQLITHLPSLSRQTFKIVVFGNVILIVPRTDRFKEFIGFLCLSRHATLIFFNWSLLWFFSLVGKLYTTIYTGDVQNISWLSFVKFFSI